MDTLLQKTFPRLIALICTTSLVACGGGGAGASSALDAAAPAATTVMGATFTSIGSPTLAPVAKKTSVPVTSATLESTTKAAQSQVPVTFGQVFAKGDVQPNVEMVGVLPDGSTIALQVDAKANHADGSLRHAVLSAVMPQLAPGQSTVISLNKTSTTRAAQSSTPAALLGAGFTAAVNLTVNGQAYSVSADALLKSGKYTTWLAGPLVNEWHVSAPLKTAAGVEHPHLSARFAIRSYTGLNKARVDVTVENDWAYEPNPSNFTYDAAITVGGQTAYQKLGLTHLHHARWRKLAWWGSAPEVHIKHNQAYLIASRAVPNYDQSITFSESTLAALRSEFSGSATEPMGTGMSIPYMPTTGGRRDIGLMPGWAATYLLTMDKRAKEVTLGTADLAGSYSSHYRDKNTDRPISLFDYPYMTIIDPHVEDTRNPATGKTEAFPACNNCATPNTFDGSHQPALAYLPYLVTGDYYYLEELQFWAMANVFASVPDYRESIKGLLHTDQVRGQAWSLRTLSEAAYITPDGHPLKQTFETILSNNLDWYNNKYSTNPSANSLGVIMEQALVYTDETGLAPWQDDYFTAAAGRAAELGYDKANALVAWKSKFPISRMTGTGACWIDAAIYSMVVRSTKTAPLFADIGSAYRASHTAAFNALACAGPEMAASLGLKVGEMTGYSSAVDGIPSTMQSALAYSAKASPVEGAAAWKLFMSRSVKPDYSQGPQFAVVPR
ncbi:hypothetical protein Q4S45_19865 [Massilia sp. R2A-15]|uniref:RIFT barrel domain-containing protein n=1 Tax=Massilia sp. R2A-15 TaxID=3064278 RepID=UPI002735ACB0|nr:hypothetical protein [Massilia sp. R2A-15]WLI88935.1 hypothetical protein Q4S45_19865 [Massilia sp. R2A-15]